MNIIRTAEDFARALSQPPDPELQTLLQAHADRLAEYADFAFEDLAMFVIVEPGDTIPDIEHGSGVRLVADGDFAMPPESIARHDGGWIEVIFILSDDGRGLVLYCQEGSDTATDLLAHCQRHLQQDGSLG